jgi:hypothetical protein
MAKLLPLFARAGVRVMFCGHEHNFQHSRADGVDYFVTGAAGKFRGGTPDRFEEARTQSWSNACHFLLVRIEGETMTVRAIGEQTGDAALQDIVRRGPDGLVVSAPISFQLSLQR